MRDQVAAIYNRVGNVKNGERLEILDRAVQIKAGDDCPRIRFGEGRAVAEKFRQHMDMVGETRRFRERRRARD